MKVSVYEKREKRYKVASLDLSHDEALALFEGLAAALGRVPATEYADCGSPYSHGHHYFERKDGNWVCCIGRSFNRT